MFVKGIGSAFILLLLMVDKSEEELYSAITPEENLIAQLGQPINISCLTPDLHPISWCEFHVSYPASESSNFTVTVLADGPGIVSNKRKFAPRYDFNYHYAGKGFQTGDCSITIKNVTEVHFGQWHCALYGVDGSTSSGTFNIAPQPISSPYFLNPQMFQELVYNFSAPHTTNVTCCSDGPLDDFNTSIIYLYLADSSDESRNSPQEEENSSRDKNRVCTTASFAFELEDNGRFIVCNLTYVMSTTEKKSLISSHSLQVKYPPKFFAHDAFQSLLSPDRVLITISFISNPEPWVTWHVVTDEKNDFSYIISENDTKYRPSLLHIGGNKYHANLNVPNHQRGKEFQIVFKVNATNEVGSSIHIIKRMLPGLYQESGMHTAVYFWKTMGVVLVAFVVFIFAAMVVGMFINVNCKLGGFSIGRKWSSITPQSVNNRAAKVDRVGAGTEDNELVEANS